jgi:hypothetical protein
MPKYAMTKKQEMLSRASEADMKKKQYNEEALAYDVSASKGKGPLGLDYTVGRDSARELANYYEQEAENLRKRTMPSINTREQYESEREAGDPNALKLSFSEWKKL